MRTHWLEGGRARVVEATPAAAGRWRLSVDGATFELRVEVRADGRLRLLSESGVHVAWVTAAQKLRFVRLDGADFVLERVTESRAARAGAPASGGLESPMPGVVTRVMVAAGDSVGKGQALVAVEAMKMEHLIRAPRAGRVVEVRARAGEMVSSGVPLVELDGS